MTIEMQVHKGEFVKGKDKNDNIIYRCNFLTDDDETITLFLDEEKVKPYLQLKKYDNCKIQCRIYKSDKGKYGITGV